MPREERVEDTVDALRAVNRLRVALHRLESNALPELMLRTLTVARLLWMAEEKLDRLDALRDYRRPREMHYARMTVKRLRDKL